MSERLFQAAAASFEAARTLSRRPAGDPARRRHGHSFRIRALATAPDDWGGVPGGAVDALALALSDVVGPLDYRDLDALLPLPSDARLARWARDRLAVPGLAAIELRGAPDRGVQLDAASDRLQVWRAFRFEAAHRLPRVPEGHPCGRMHGHGFGVTLHADPEPGAGGSGDEDPDGAALARAWAPLHDELHQVCLNDIDGLDNPTSERLAAWIWDRLAPTLPGLRGVIVHETHSAGCHYDGAHYRIWKDLRFEAGVRLVRAPAGDPRRCLHGHGYRLRLHLSAPLDQVRGWTVDYGDVKRAFQPVYQRLDHQRLDRLPELEDADPASLARWIRREIGDALPPLDRIDLEPTPERGVLLTWGALPPALSL